LLPDLSRRNVDLQLCVEALGQQAKKHGALFVDLFSNPPALTKNGLHVTTLNQALLAHRIASGFGYIASGGFYRFGRLAQGGAGEEPLVARLLAAFELEVLVW
jgi:hypothetical protein